MHIILAAFIEELTRSLGWLKHGAVPCGGGHSVSGERSAVYRSVAEGGRQVGVEPQPLVAPPGGYDRYGWIAEGSQAGLPPPQGQGRVDKKQSGAGPSGWQQDAGSDVSPGEYVTFTRDRAASRLRSSDQTLERHTSEEYEEPEPITCPDPAHAASLPRRSRRRRHTMACCGQKKVLMVTTSICASASFAFLCIAVATDYWLFSRELKHDPQGGPDYFENTYTGLWRKCVVNGTMMPQCEYVKYFEEVDMDGLGPTASILASMRRSTIFPLISLLILLIGEIVCFVGHCNHKKKVLTFVAGILFVIGGLCTLIGLILYIGAITGEVGNKPKNSMDEPEFTYWYGSSFMLTVASFVVSELTGVLAVYLYISRHKHAYRKKQERLTMVDTNERQPHVGRYRRSRSSDRSRDHSQDNSPCHSDTYYTYTPVSDSSKEVSNYAIPREMSRHTVSTSVETHLSKEHSLHSVRDLDTYARRTTPV